MQQNIDASTTVQLAAWSAWAPGLVGRAEWEAWLSGRKERVDGHNRPACADVPPALRRRCTRLTRMVLESGLAACRAADVGPDSVRTVFCSRFGEIALLHDLLNALADCEPMSPKQFGNSVHHTATGYFDLVTRNRLPSRTLSAGSDNLAFGFLETTGFLRKHPEDPCLLIFADEPLPEPFAGPTTGPQFPFAVALILTSGADSEATRLRFTHSTSENTRRSSGTEADIFAFLRWLVGEEPELALNTNSGTWKWNR